VNVAGHQACPQFNIGSPTKRVERTSEARCGTGIDDGNQPAENQMNQARELMVNAFHHNDTVGVAEFARTARGRHNREVARHLLRLQTLRALYDITADGEVEAICDEMEREEDWLQVRLDRCA
jgi:hypothetical protein